jgi:hypothetical protein
MNARLKTRLETIDDVIAKLSSVRPVTSSSQRTVAHTRVQDSFLHFSHDDSTVFFSRVLGLIPSVPP